MNSMSDIACPKPGVFHPIDLYHFEYKDCLSHTACCWFPGMNFTDAYRILSPGYRILKNAEQRLIIQIGQL